MSNRTNNYTAPSSSVVGGENAIENAAYAGGRITGSAMSGAIMAAAGNATPTSLDSQDSNSDMDGIEWDDESGDEENLGLLFWDELPPGDSTTSPPSTSVVDGGMGREGGGANGEDNEIPIINPGDQSAEYMAELFGMQQNVNRGTKSNFPSGPYPQGGGEDPGSMLANLIAKSLPNAGLQSRDGNTPVTGDAVGFALPPTNYTMGGAPAPSTGRGSNYAEISAFFPSPSGGKVPSLLEAQDAQHQKQALGVFSLGSSALKVAADATGGGRHSSLGTISGPDCQSFVQVPSSSNVNDQWAVHQLQQLAEQQLPCSMNSLSSKLPLAAVNHPSLGAVAPTTPHSYLMWLLQQQQQTQEAQAQQQGSVVAQVQALPSNTIAEGAAVSSSAAQMTLNQLQLFQFLQPQHQQQQQVQSATSQQQQPQSTLMQVSSEQLQSMQSQLHQQQSVVANSSTTQSWLGNPLPQHPHLKSLIPSGQAATLQAQGPVKDGKRTRAGVSTKDSTTLKRKKPNRNQSQRKERPQFAVATATVAHTPPRTKQSTSQNQIHLQRDVAPTTKTFSTTSNSAPANSAAMPLVSASDTEGGGQLEWTTEHSKKRAARGGSISPNYFYTSTEECSGTEDHLKFATEEQRVQYNRERNREHAKNTRIRKKAFVEQLKLSVDELCRERDSLISERAMAANLMVETHSKRVDVLRSVFALRAGYGFDQKRELWSSILDESSFTCRLPVTPYQSFPSSEVQVSNCQRTIVGVDAMISDAASNYVFLDSIVDRAQFPDGKIKFQYTLVTEESVVAGNQLMARWAMSTINAKNLGANAELHQSGMLICKFNTAHKIVALEIMFDVMAFMLQVKMAMGFDNFNDVVIPNTVQTCSQKVYDYPMVMTLATRPYTIVQVNERWEKLTGYSKQEVVGKHSCSILQGRNHHVNTVIRYNAGVEGENKKELDRLMGPLMFQRPSCAMLTNYTKFGRRYRQYVTIYPLSTDSNILHYFGLTTFVQWMDDEDVADDVVAGDCKDVDNNISGSLSTGYRNDGNTTEQVTPNDVTILPHESKYATNGEPSVSRCSSGNSRRDGGDSSSTSPSSSSLPPPASTGKGMKSSELEKQSSSSFTSSMSNDTDQQ